MAEQKLPKLVMLADFCGSILKIEALSLDRPRTNLKTNVPEAFAINRMFPLWRGNPPCSPMFMGKPEANRLSEGVGFHFSGRPS